MVGLSLVHVIYLVLIVAFLIIMMLKKSIVVPCAVGIFLIGYLMTGNVVQSFQALFNTIVWSGKELFGVISVIALVVAMSKALGDIGADRLMVKPLQKMVRGPSVAFFVLGIVMFLVSLCIWPSPAVALVGALMLPMARTSGIPIIWAAVAMNIFGHGMALSGDFFIQGAPTIAATAANTTVSTYISGYVPLWSIMSLTVLIVAFIMFQYDMKKTKVQKPLKQSVHTVEEKADKKAVFVAIATPVVFIVDVILMVVMKLQGGDATALVGGTAILILVITDLLNRGPGEMFEEVAEHLKEGFSFGIRIFAPVIVIGGFFFLGAEDAAKAVFGAEATGLLGDIGTYLAQNVPLSKFPVVIVQAIIAVITGLDGSGFSGLPLVGASAETFSNAIAINKEALAGMGQIITIWVGGGTIIPWAVIPVAAICNVSPVELVRKNIVPVFCGIIAVIIATLILV